MLNKTLKQHLKSSRPVSLQFRSVHGTIFSAAAVLGCLVSLGWMQLQTASLRQQAALTQQQISAEPVKGLVSAIQAVGANQSRLPWMLPEVQSSLLDAVQSVRERNRFDLKQPIHAVRFSPNGQTLAAAGESGDVYLWERQNQAQRLLEGDGQTIGALNFSPDGTALFGNPAELTGTAQFWQLAADSPYQAPSQSLASGAFSSDGQMMISGSGSGSVRLWDQQGQPVAQLYPRLGSRATRVAFEAASIVTGSEDGQIALWNDKGNPLGTLWAGASIQKLQLSQAGQRIISQDLNRQQAFLWNAQSGQWQQFLLGETQTVTATDLSADNQLVVRGQSDGSLEIAPLDRQSSIPAQSFLGHAGAVQAVSFSPDQKTVVSGGEDGTVRLWDRADGTLVSRYSLREWIAQPSVMALSLDGQQIAAGGLGSISLGRYDQQSRRQFSTAALPKRLFHLRDGLAIQTDLPGATVISLQNSIGQQQAKLSLPLPSPRSLALSATGEWLSLSQQGSLQLWSPQGKPIGAAIPAEAATQFLLFSPDGRQAMTGGSASAAGTTCYWRVTPTGLKQQACQNVASRAIAFSPNGRRAAVGLADGKIGLWDLRTNRFTTWKSHQTSITAIAFRADGERIASGSDQGIIQLSDLQGKAIGQPLIGSPAAIQALAFTPAQTLVSLAQDGELRLWQASWQAWLKTACQRLQNHPVFTQPDSATQAAKATCQRNGSFDSAQPAPVQPAPVQPAAAQTRLVVKLAERRVDVYRNQTVQASYPIAVGKAGWETPTGTFKIFNMVQNPGWTNPLTGAVLEQSRKTPLGSRWMAFWSDGVNQIGFHATPDRRSVGNAVSHGCLRMYEEDAQALYEQIKLGTSVTVEP